MDDALDELQARLGPAAVLTDGLEPYETPARGPRGRTAAVIRPADTDDVRATVAWARTHRIRLLPQGANSGLVGASTPTAQPEPVVVLSTERLRRSPSIDPVDRTAVVGAGIRLSELNEAAGAHGLSLAIDLGADPSIGGMVATNTGGSRMVRNGDMRRHVLGVRAVLADEQCSVVDELAVVRKHNTGPALTQLLVGSGGGFGIVTDVAVELDRLPEEVATAWLVPTDAGAVLGALLSLERRVGSHLSAFEVCSAEAVDAARHHPARPPDPLNGREAPPLLVLVELSGPAGVDDTLLSELAALHADGLIEDAVALPPADAWALRHLISEGLALIGTVVGHDVSVPRSALPAARLALHEAVGARFPGLVVADFGHWGDGGMHLNVVVPGDRPRFDEDRRRELTDLVLDTVVSRFGGSFSAEHGIGPHNARFWNRTVSAGTRMGLAALKQAVDPLGILGHPGLPY